jgi:hypothetical protein
VSGYLTRLAARTGLGQAATPAPAIAEHSTGSPIIAEGTDGAAAAVTAPPERETFISVGQTDGPEHPIGHPRVTQASAAASFEIEPAAPPVVPIPGPWPDPDRLLADARPTARQEADASVTATGQPTSRRAPIADWPSGRRAVGDPASVRQAAPPATAITVETLAPDGSAWSPSMPMAAPALATPNPGNAPRLRQAEDRYPAPRSPEPSVGPFAAATPRPPDAQVPVPRPDHRRTGGDGVEVKIGSVSLEIVHRPANPEPPPAPPPPARRATQAGDTGVLRRLHVRRV